MLHHEYSDTSTIGNPQRSSVEQGECGFRAHQRSFGRVPGKEVKKFPFEVPAEKRDWPGRFWKG